MEATVRFLLFTMLATAATAKYEYTNEASQSIDDTMRKLDEVQEVDFNHMDDPVEWIFHKASTAVVDFVIKDPSKSSGENCGEGPALIIDEGPYQCLYGITFIFMTIEENDYVQLAILFRNSQDDSNNRVMLSEVYTKPEDPAQDLSNIVFVEPIPRQELLKARNKQPFAAPVSWVKELLDKGIYAGTIDSDDRESVGDTADTDVAIMYTTYPVIIDWDILNQILEMRSPP